MRKFLFNGILFSVILIIIICIVEIQLRKNTKTYIDLHYEEALSPEVNANIVIIGNSHAGGIDPALLENDRFTIYNFFLGGGSPHYYRIWYEKIFKTHYPKPEHLIFVVDWAMLDSSLARKFEVDISMVPFSTILDVFINEPGLSKKALLTKQFKIITNRKELKYVFCSNIRNDVKNNYHGFYPTIKKDPIMGFSPDSTTVSKLQLSEFIKLVDLLKKDNINIIFVSTPEYQPSVKAKSIIDAYSIFENIAAEKDIPYLNYNKNLASEFNYDSTYYNDWVHLNKRGANKFSKMLSNDLKKIINGF